MEPEQYFYLKDGQVLRNVEELRQASLAMADDVFQHHVTAERNDFHNWVNDVHGNIALAGRIASAKNGREMAGIIASHTQATKKIEAPRVKKVRAKVQVNEDTKALEKVIKENTLHGENSCEHEVCMLCGIKNFLIGIGVGILAGLLLSTFL